MADVIEDVSPREPATAIFWTQSGELLTLSQSAVRLWDPKTGSEIRRLTRRRDSAGGPAAAYAPSRDLLVETTRTGLELWSLKDGSSRLLPLSDGASISALAFSNSGDLLAVGTRAGNYCLMRVDEVWNSSRLALEKQVTCSEWISSGSQAIDRLSFSHNDEQLAIGSWNQLSVEDFQGSRAIYFRLPDASWGHVTQLEFTPTGDKLVVTSQDGRSRIWNLQSEAPVLLEQEVSKIVSSAVSSRGNVLLTGSNDGRVMFWDLSTGMALHQVPINPSAVTGFAVKSNGSYAAAATADGSYVILDLASGKKLAQFAGHSRRLSTMALSPNGAWMAIGHEDGTSRLWNRQEDPGPNLWFAPTQSLLGPMPNAIALSGDSKKAAMGFLSGVIRVWPDAKRSPNLYSDLQTSSAVSALIFHPGSQRLVAGHEDGSISFNDLENLPHSSLRFQHQGSITTLAIDSTKAHIFAGSKDGVIRQWDLKADTEILALETPGFFPQALAIGEDQNLIMALRPQTTSEGSTSIHVVQLSLPSSSGPIDVESLDGLRLEGDLSIALPGSGRTLVIGHKQDSRIEVLQRTADPNADEAWSHEATLLGGSQGVWIACLAEGPCHIHDNGTFLVEIDAKGHVRPIPTRKTEPLQLEVNPLPTAQEGTVRTLEMEVINKGKEPVYWLRLESTDPTDPDLTLFPFSAVPILSPGQTSIVKANAAISMSFHHPVPLSRPLNARLTTSSGTTFDVKPIQIKVQVPEPVVERIRWLNDASRLQVDFENQGQSPLRSLKVTARVDALDLTLSNAETYDLEPGDQKPVSFDLPDGIEIEPGTPVTLEAWQESLPTYRWVLASAPRESQVYWFLSLLLATLVLLGATFFTIQQTRRYKDPIYLTLRQRPKAIFELEPSALETARGKLERTSSLESILRKAGVQQSWFDLATHFGSARSPEDRSDLLAKRLRIEIKESSKAPNLRLMELGANFPLNLHECGLLLPDADQSTTDILASLRNQEDESVTLIVSSDEEVQNELNKETGPENHWIAPTPQQLTRLLLSPDPLAELADLAAHHVHRLKISPYRSGGGVERDSAFFGRDEQLSAIIHGDPKNFLIVGARQVGKTSLLKAIQRRLRQDTNVKTYYISVSQKNLVASLAAALGIKKKRFATEALVLHLHSLPKGLRHIFLLDEIDSFIAEDSQNEYSTLQRLRSLSDGGFCQFILSGFWNLHEAVVDDYHSPIKNFGETMFLGPLEKEACHQLVRDPMATMHLGYESEELVSTIVQRTGQRANLINIVCLEILRRLPKDQETIRGETVTAALDSDAVRNALGGWSSLGGDDREASWVDQLVVYATIRQNSFQSSDAADLLEGQGRDLPIGQIQNSLKRLELAGFLTQKQGLYSYQIPLFVDMILEMGPDEMLKRTLRFGPPTS